MKRPHRHRRPGRAVAAGLLGLLLASSAAPAQTAGDAGGEGPAPRPLQDDVRVRLKTDDGQDGRAGPTAAEVSALRYWASREDSARVEAEVERLRRRYPDWEPPADLFEPATSVDERPLWALYDEGDYDAVREAIARLEAEHPDWQPPRKLLELMRMNEVRARLAALADEGAWQQLLEVADAHPGEIGCARIDNLWRVAEARHALKQADAAFETYRHAIETCTTPEHRIATLQKAAGKVGRGRLEELFALERNREKPAEAARRIAEIERELTAPGLPPALEHLFADELSRDDLAAAEAEVLRREHAGGAAKLGWLHFDAGAYADALTWFERADRWGASADTAEGLARAHAALGHRAEVEALAETLPEVVGPLLPELRAGWIAEAFARDDAGSVLQEAGRQGTPDALIFRGWTLLRLERPTEAAIAFRRVAEDEALPLVRRREGAYGLARAEIAIGDLEAAVAVAEFYGLARERRHEIRAEIMVRRAARAFEREDYRTCLALLEARRSFAEPTRDLLIQEAWARYHLGQKTVARRIFERLNRIQATPDTVEGLKVVNGAINGF